MLMEDNNNKSLPECMTQNLSESLLVPKASEVLRNTPGFYYKVRMVLVYPKVGYEH